MHVDLADGRTLDVEEGGAPDGIPVVVHHGTPGAAVLHPAWAADAAERGLRLVTYARPGYGASTRVPGRRVADAVSDVAAIADALGIERLLTWGWSGGGPHALACAALLPERVAAAALLSSVGPFDAPDLDFLDGMGPGNVEEFGKTIAGGEAAIRAGAEADARRIVDLDVDALVAEFEPYLTPTDAVEMRDHFGATWLAQMKVGFVSGADGWIDDDLLFVQPWGFDLASVRVPVLLMQGEADAMVPFQHGKWLAAHIPGVEARLVREDGHLTPITTRIGEVHEWLLEHWA